MLKTWLAVDEDGTEAIYDRMPFRNQNGEIKSWVNGLGHFVDLPKGSILKLISKKLTWNDEPYLHQ